MCGIVGAIAQRDVVPVLIEGLKRLEYRGYDSSGIAVVEEESMRRVRRTGRVSEMEAAALADGLSAQLGIGHTRWATHGGVTETNAHPHMSEGVALVHNGIIENHETLRAELADASGRLVIVDVPVHEDWVGLPLSRLEAAAHVRVAYVTRLGEGIVPGPSTAYQDGDLVHLVIATDRVEQVERILDAPPARQEA